MNRFTCPHCQKKLKAPERAAGRIIACPGCNQSLVIPPQAPSRPLPDPASSSGAESSLGKVPINCPGCGRSILVMPDQLSLKLQCAQCNTVFTSVNPPEAAEESQFALGGDYTLPKRPFPLGRITFYTAGAFVLILLGALIFVAAKDLGSSHPRTTGERTVSRETNEETVSIIARILILLVFLAIGIVFYFLPSILAALRGHHNAAAIFILNFFLGWTFLGWVASLVWSATAVDQRLK